MANVLGVSFGPHATLVEVRDADSGRLVSTGRVHHAELGPHEEDPTAWWRSLAAAITRAGERQIAAISVSGGHPGLVLLDTSGVVLRPMQPWDDAVAEVTRLQRKLGPERWARRAGALPDATTAVTRLSWLRRADPATFARVGMVLLPHDWLTFRMAGRPVTDRGSASLTGLWSPHTNRWIPDVLELLGGRAEDWVGRLPDVVASDEQADWLDAPVYELLGLRGRPLVAPGTGEAMAVSLALGLTRGRIGVALGEGTMVLSRLEEPVVDPEGAVHSRADATGRHLAVAHAAGGARLVDAVAELLDLHVADLGLAALEADPAADGAVITPGVIGRTGAIVTGLASGVGRADFARATFEGIASAALDAVDALLAAGARWYDDEPLHLTGPADGLDAHARVFANLSGRPVVATSGSLAAAGACIQAAAVLQGAQPEELAATWALTEGEPVEPEDDPERDDRRAVHTEERARQDRAWDEG